MKKLYLIAIAAMLLLVGCNEPTPPQLDANGNAVPQAQQSGPGWGTAALAGMAGYFMGRSSSQPSAPSYAPSSTTTVNRTVINRTYIVKPAEPVAPKPEVKPLTPLPQTPVAAPKPVAPVVAAKPAVPSYAPKPSYAPSPAPRVTYSSSFSSRPSSGGRR